MNARNRKSGSTPKNRGRADKLVFLPLGGAGEIGMNLYLYGFGPVNARKWIMVDLGISFADLRDPGIDVLLPDIAFIEEHRSDLLGIILTHAHEDHFGAIGYLWADLKAPIYATAFTAALLGAKLAEYQAGSDIPVNVIKPGQRLSLGPFDVELIEMSHSIPEPNAVAIRTPLGNVLHTGDWKIDIDPVIPPKTDENALRAFGKEGCRALVCDSTNALRSGSSASETEIESNLIEVIRGASGRVAVTTFASNVGRLQSVGLAAQKTGRRLFVLGRAMLRIIEVARATGYLKDFPRVLGEEDFASMPRDKVLCLCTGSQGERRAALSRVAEESHPTIKLSDGDTVIFSSRTIPGNEKAIGEVINNLAGIGVEVITDAEAPIHVTGHPRRDELAQLYDWLKPDLLIPMHGEMRHMRAQARFARERGIAEAIVARNGDMVQIAPAPAGIVDEAPSGRLYLDGNLLLDGEDDAIRRRRRLAFAGAVAVTVIVDDKGRSRGEPKLALFGIPEYGEDGALMADIVLDVIDEVFDTLPKPKRRNADSLAETVRRAIVREVEAAWGKRPLCQVDIARI